jgi:hypothetical protein
VREPARLDVRRRDLSALFLIAFFPYKGYCRAIPNIPPASSALADDREFPHCVGLAGLEGCRYHAHRKHVGLTADLSRSDLVRQCADYTDCVDKNLKCARV